LLFKRRNHKSNESKFRTNELSCFINKRRLLSFRSPVMGAIVEDVRTGFERRGDSAVTIPELTENILM